MKGCPEFVARISYKTSFHFISLAQFPVYFLKFLCPFKYFILKVLSKFFKLFIFFLKLFSQAFFFCNVFAYTHRTNNTPCLIPEYGYGEAYINGRTVFFEEFCFIVVYGSFFM